MTEDRTWPQVFGHGGAGVGFQSKAAGVCSAVNGGTGPRVSSCVGEDDLGQ